MSVNQNAEVSVKVNGEEARRRLQELETIARGFRKEMAKAQEQGNNTEFKRLNQSLKETKREMNKMRRLGYNVNEVMKRLDQSSPNELRNALRSINQQLNSGNIARGSKEWNEYNENARKVRDTLSSIRREQYESESWLSRAGIKFKNFFSSVLVQLGAITGMSWGAQQSIKEYLNLEESYSSLMKYAGMTHDEVKGLNEEFKKIDTRTAREQLNQLGGEAGKLGIKGKKDILEFVEASDLINLALGQDLGAEGVKNIGKLALMFGEDKTLGLKNAMLATGSAINELAQSSTASEPYLAGFAARLGGVGLQANIAQTSILGYGSVLDQNMQSQEIAATSLQTVILKMFETPKLFAQASGKSVDEFTKLLKEDANEALLTFLESLNKMGGLEDLAPLFKELNLGGTRASGVISTLASKVDDIREAQELATSAYQQGNSVVDEANVKNNTAQAILEKKQQALRDEAELLGEVLFPLQTSGLGLLAKQIKTITTVITFSVKHARTLIALAATIASYNVALKINVMWNERKIKTSTTSLALDKLQVVWTKAKTAALWLYVAAKEALAGRTQNATLAMKHFFNLLKINPFALIVSSVVALAGAIYVLSNRLSAAEKAQRSLNKIRGEAQSSMEGEKAQLLSLYKIASDETLAKEKRFNAIKKINEISPEYFGNLDLEKIKTGEAKEAIDDYVKSQIRAIEVQSTMDRMSEIDREQKELKESYDDDSLWGAIKGIPRNVAHIFTAGWVDTEKKSLRIGMEELATEKEELTKFLTDKYKEELEKPTVANTKPTGGKGMSEKEAEERLKKQLAEIERWLAVARAKETFSYVQGEQNKEEYNKALEQLEIEGLERRMALYKEGSAEFAKLQEDYLLKKKALEDQAIVRSREVLQKEIEEEKGALKQRFIEGYISLKEYQEQSFDMEVRHLDRMAKSYAQGDAERSKLEKQKEELLLKDKLQKREEFEKRKEALYKEYSQKSDDELMNLELDALRALHNEKLLTEEEFLKAQKALQEKYQTENPTFLESDQGKAMIEKTKFALSSMHTLMSSFDGYMQASADAEIAKINEKYDAEIKSAGNNQYQLKKIEERKQQEINKVNAKYADKALKYQLAMAISQALQGSINAYTSTAAIPIIGPAMAPIAAGVALAAGMLNVAAVKKQHAAARQGFYKGGFTGSGRWDEEKGVVHADEFVANRHAVRNPNVRPVLELINRAQKNNTIGSLTSADFVQTLGGVASPTIGGVTPAPAVDNAPMLSVLSENARIMSELKKRLEEPFVTINTVDGDYGMKRAFDAYNQQERNKSRK